MSERTTIIVSFLATSLLGCTFLVWSWSGRGAIDQGMIRGLGFVGIMAGAHTVGFRLYRRQSNAPEPSAPLSSRYVPAFRLALIEQVLLLGLSSLMLDGGRAFRICAIAVLAYWATSLVLAWRRPTAPTRFDLAFLRYGSLMLPIVVGSVVRIVGR
jgi:hypothetical protein